MLLITRFHSTIIDIIYEIQNDFENGVFIDSISIEFEDTNTLVNSIDILVDIEDKLSNFNKNPKQYKHLYDALILTKALITNIEELIDKGIPKNSDDSINILSRYLEEKIAYVCEREAPIIKSILKLFGLLQDLPIFIEDTFEDGFEDNYMSIIDIDEPYLKFGSFHRVFSDLKGLLKEEYTYILNDESVIFLSTILFDRLDELLISIGFLAEYINTDKAPGSGYNITSDHSLFVGASMDEASSAQFGLLANKILYIETNIQGLAVYPFASIERNQKYTINDEISSYINISGDVSSDGFLVLADNFNIEFFGPDITSYIETGIIYKANEDIVLIGHNNKSNLSISGVTGSFFINNDLNRGDVGIKARFDNLSLTVKGSSGDGFISNILSTIDLKADFSLLTEWSTVRGFTFDGGCNLNIIINIHIDLGVIKITSLIISLIPNNNSLRLKSSVDVLSNLGPLEVSLKNIGLDSSLDFETGNLGPFNFTSGFKPPDGAGLTIDASVIKGGGYLRYNSENESYEGVLELIISEWISLKAITLITTKMPDGSKGFSLLAIITAEFDTGITLSMGFTLEAVGGLLGLNRSYDSQALSDGIKSGAIERIMFPTDIVENAPRIISDLRAFFPATQDNLLIGPMIKLGWGTPVVATASIGIILQFATDDFQLKKIAILGTLRIILPDEKLELLLIQVDVGGEIDFEKKQLWFSSRMFDSHILKVITLEGDFGLLVEWGSDPEFVMSAGGFHPLFQPPPLPSALTSLKRISTAILNEKWGRIRVETYFAVTSNTVQTGVFSEVWFGFGPAGIEGHLGYDVLFQFSPFYFIAQISAKFSLIGIMSIHIKLSLSGPAPWNAKGYGKVSLFFFSIKVRFDETWGQERKTELPTLKVMPLLKQEFEKLENWTAVLPNARHISVTLRKIVKSSEDTSLVLHPVGALKISQRSIPLGLRIVKIGNQPITGLDRFTVESRAAQQDCKPENNAVITLRKKSETREKFALGQFLEMEDVEKLSRPSFETSNSGLVLSANDDSESDLRSSHVVHRIVSYETIILDSEYRRKAFDLPSLLLLSFSNHLLLGASISKSALSAYQAELLVPFEDKVVMSSDAYVLAFQKNNTLSDQPVTAFQSEAEARDYLGQQLRHQPSLKDELHIIPQYELEAA